MYKKVDTTLNFLDREKEVLEFWKETSKKSINEKDLEELVSNKKAIAIPHSYIRKSQSSLYDTSSLTKECS